MTINPVPFVFLALIVAIRFGRALVGRRERVKAQGKDAPPTTEPADNWQHMLPGWPAAALNLALPPQPAAAPPIHRRAEIHCLCSVVRLEWVDGQWEALLDAMARIMTEGHLCPDCAGGFLGVACTKAGLSRAQAQELVDMLRQKVRRLLPAEKTSLLDMHDKLEAKIATMRKKGDRP